MELVVDGIIYQLQSQGGASRIFSEVLPRICRLDESLRIILLTSGPCRQPLPTHPHIHHRPTPRVELILRPSRLWGSIVPFPKGQRLYIGNTRNKIWHSTYYTMPYKLGKASWRGSSVVTVLDMIHEKFPAFFGETKEFSDIKRRCIKQADKVIAISESTKRDILEYFRVPESKVTVTYLAASEFFSELPEAQRAKFKARLGLNKPFILYVGHRGGYKNFQMLLETYSFWKKRNDFDLIAIGGQSNWSIDEINVIAKANLGKSVKLIDNVRDKELIGFYSCAQAFIYPSLYEGFGIPPLEAMACGTPAVVSNSASIPEVVGDAGLYFNPYSKEELLASLNNITENPGLREELVKRGKERIKRFTWFETASKVYNVYREIA